MQKQTTEEHSPQATNKKWKPLVTRTTALLCCCSAFCRLSCRLHSSASTSVQKMRSSCSSGTALVNGSSVGISSYNHACSLVVCTTHRQIRVEYYGIHRDVTSPPVSLHVCTYNHPQTTYTYRLTRRTYMHHHLHQWLMGLKFQLCGEREDKIVFAEWTRHALSSSQSPSDAVG